MKLLKILKNRYVIATIIFLVYLLFFDQYNFRAQYRLLSELNQLKEEKQFYQQELTKDSLTYYTLFNNKENLEKFARERFLMKKENEDIFLIVPE
jgi:cell division protein DivIC